MDDTVEPPDLQIAIFQLWVLGREFPDSEDYWDGNWLNVRARCTTPFARVHAEGSFLRLPELKTWLDQCRQMCSSLSGKAHLKCMEPNLKISLEMLSGGKCSLEILLTHDHMLENHCFESEIDQTHLPPLIAHLEKILKTYPIKDPE